MKFWLLFLWDPVQALDLTDSATGRPAYSKVLGLLAFSALYVLALVEIFLPWTRPVDWVKWSLLFAAPFGVLGLRTWFSSRVAQRRDESSEPDMYRDDERGDWRPEGARPAGFSAER